MGLSFFFVWKIFKLSLTCKGGDGGGSGGNGGNSGSGDNGFGGSDGGFDGTGGYGYNGNGGYSYDGGSESLDNNDNNSSNNNVNNSSNLGGVSQADVDNALGFGDNTCNYSSSDGIGNAFGGSENAFSSINNNSNNNGWGSPAIARTINTNIAPPTVTTFNSNMDIVSTTTNTISKTNNGYEITSNTVTNNSFDTNLDHVTVTRYSANGTETMDISGGTVASHLVDMGLSAPVAISAVAIGKVVVSSLLGVGTAGLTLETLSAVTQVLGVTGILSQSEYNDATMAIGIASAMLGAYHTMETISAVTSEFGYMTATQKALSITISALSIKNTIDSFQSINEKYGIEPSDINISDIANINFNNNSSLLEHYEKVVQYTKKQQPSYGTNPSNWQLIDKMAGSYLFDCFLAGSNFFNSTIKPTQIMGSVGCNYNIPIFAKQSFLEEDFLATLNDFNKILNIYEQNSNIMFSIKI